MQNIDPIADTELTLNRMALSYLLPHSWPHLESCLGKAP